MAYNPNTNITALNGNALLTGNGVTGTGAIRVTISSDNTAYPIKIDQTTPGTTNAFALAQLGANAILTGNGVTGTGSLRVTIASDNTAFNVITTPVTPTTLTLNSAATTNATSVKASAGTLYAVTCSNAGAAAAFVKLYNKASAPTVGTDVPVLTIPIPASSVVSINLGENGQRFTTGIALAITNLVADTDTTAVAASQVKVMGAYI